MRVVLDPAQPYAELADLLPWVDVPIVPLQWARAWMPDQSAEAAAEALFRAGADIAVVTKGERGSVVCWEGGAAAYPSFSGGCGGYDRRWRRLPRRLHGGTFAELGNPNHCALCRSSRVPKLPGSGGQASLAQRGRGGGFAGALS